MLCKPIGYRPMTPLERKRRQRARLLPPFEAAKVAQEIEHRLWTRHTYTTSDGAEADEKVKTDLLGVIAELIWLYKDRHSPAVIDKEMVTTRHNRNQFSYIVSAKVEDIRNLS
jgi:hypothetical protein